jgi:cobyrinic acid a,c-diamide synthase
VTPDEYSDLESKVSSFREMIRKHVDIDSLYCIIESAAPLVCEYDDTQVNDGEILKIAVARDEAFSFYYKENMNELMRHGIEPVYFSPLHDSAIPEGVSALMLRGGYPELYAKELSENTSMKASIRSAVEQGMPSIAECGGFMYLLDSLTADDGTTYPMTGLIKGSCRNTGRLGRFGYITVTGKADDESLLSGLSIKAHEFHYFDSDNNGSGAVAVKPGSGRSWECMHTGKGHLWGYPHLYYPSCPELVARLRTAMKGYLNK